ncbi:MAG: response regulator [Desulfobacula sp.]|uniref:response regulator n=1 Tax=Desulfobacula sp. TaxID=2593537 RepID=UPI001D62685F|nr:response regulator [Desulfobacula sp.]MBT3805350.1 response regulator [Desulfobacula sp.]MBT4024503.1 response regulator [Desulfobacula sp.]MBT4199823.1 response regulator [Desulfobacula sp.]MBT4507801.1 response regulator [Desulfobacula sp.]
MSKILIVDDDKEYRENLKEILDNAGYPNDMAGSAKQAMQKLGDQQFDVVLLDFMMPGIDGINALGEFKKISPNSKIIMITAFASIENAVIAIKKGASEYISKPFKIEALLLMIKQVIEELRFEGNIKKLKLEGTLSSLSNSIRREIIRLFQTSKKIRLMETARKLDIEDHTKLIFHLKTLRAAKILRQDMKHAYMLTKEGKKVLECLNILDNYLSDK